ncbi:hypothetical protein GC167_05980 [bacterium]|nr:hypothetical protein [bacterium]
MALTQKAAHRKDVGKIADMQHRHFATVATIIADMKTSPRDNWTHTEIAGHFAALLRQTNANFDRDRFLRACGVEP